jgi:hypothetical protein
MIWSSIHQMEQHKMTRKSLASMAALVFLSLTPALAHAQAACRPMGREMTMRRDYLSRIVTDSSSEFARAMMSLPMAADSAVVPITDPALCAKAREAYVAGLPPELRETTKSVFVIRVGDVYTVDDPAVKVGKFSVVMTLDADFAVLSQRTQ